MTDDKRAELTRLAKVAWAEDGEFSVRTGDDCFDFHDGIELDGLIEHGGYVRIGIYKHPRADDAMLAALRVLAGEQPAVGLSEREAAFVTGVHGRITANADAIARDDLRAVHHVFDDDVARLLVIIDRLTGGSNG